MNYLILHSKKYLYGKQTIKYRENELHDSIIASENGQLILRVPRAAVSYLAHTSPAPTRRAKYICNH